MNNNLKNTSVPNNRKQKRVIRNDVVVVLEHKNSKKACPLFVELLNISPEGIAIRYKKSLRVSKSINMKLSFSDGREYFMKGRIIYKKMETVGGESRIHRTFKKLFQSGSIFYQYGIKFKKVDADFQATFIATKLQDMGGAKKQYKVDFI